LKYKTRSTKPRPELAHEERVRYEPVSSRTDRIAQLIVQAAFTVHKALGPGLLESVYEICFCHEMSKSILKFERQVNVPIVYDDIRFEEALRLDVLVENLIICELKAVDVMLPVFKAQLLSQMKLTNKRLGFLINFHVPRIKDGIERVIL
jgi:GxxExxY protein